MSPNQRLALSQDSRCPPFFLVPTFPNLAQVPFQHLSLSRERSAEANFSSLKPGEGILAFTAVPYVIQLISAPVLRLGH
jgi:hypothetical protein